MLSDAVDGRAAASAPSDAGELLDRDALDAYRRRLHEIDAEIDEAAAWADVARGEGLQRERDALLAEVRRATGLDGRSRRAPATNERARVAVRKAIASSIERIERHDP